ncbi:hypothetical protein LDG_6207 [Legionella drancourtii LLAP12]|uniref:Uncharacterized protein n=1 Tax=Legionella drancourtii LLAP12 TaxID=658187 RepID=G9ELU7_9GAMM|nr:hypothetical protein LDG_6207 [Legionella drancourtii LLAP12]
MDQINATGLNSRDNCCFEQANLRHFRGGTLNTSYPKLALN